MANTIRVGSLKIGCVCFSLSLSPHCVFLVSEGAELQMTIPEIGFQCDDVTTTSLNGRIRRPGLPRALTRALVREGQPLPVPARP